jgi:hypothetical protein
MLDDRADPGRTRMFEMPRTSCRRPFLRWHAADAAAIRSAEAWLVATTTRLAIDRLRMATPPIGQA